MTARVDKLGCGCVIRSYGFKVARRSEIRFCAKHEAAPDMAAALAGLLGAPYNPTVGEPGHVEFGDALKMARAALAKARGDD